jgi:hypothetical protein
VIIDAIEPKHGKEYTGSRTLIVVLDDYSLHEHENTSGGARPSASRPSSARSRTVCASVFAT